EREEQVARNLLSKLLTYATGRLPTSADRREIERMLREARPQGFRLRDLVHLVAERLLTEPPPPTEPSTKQP
ncbi:MAG: DUF1585 domain-containing protein, partial [Planctomycetaceae bacterium]